jgi:hypothetical protein
VTADYYDGADCSLSLLYGLCPSLGLRHRLQVGARHMGHLKLVILKVQIPLEQLRAIQSIEKTAAFMESEN